MIFQASGIVMRPCSVTFHVLMILYLLCVMSSCTFLTFYVDHEVEQPLDFVEINAVIKADGQSLEKAIEDAATTIQSIETLVDNYCKTYTPRDKQKKECKDIVDASAYSIKPQYQLLHKKASFSGFVVAHEIDLKVKDSDHFGKLVDDIMKIGVNKINSLEWKPKQEINGEEIVLEQGVQQAHQICKKIGSSLDKIIDVSEVTDFGEEEYENGEKEEEQQSQEQQQQEQPQNLKEGIVYYKFVVECVRKKIK